MKNSIKKSLVALILICSTFPIFGQNQDLKHLAVLPIQSINFEMDSKSLTELAIMSINKTNKFVVMDNYNIQSIAKENDISIDNPKVNINIIEFGKKLSVTYIITGEVHKYGNNIILSIKMFDIKSGKIILVQTDEYLYLPNHIKSMFELTINRLFKRNYDEELFIKLTDKTAYDNSINNLDNSRLALDGPRMGISFMAGENAKILQKPEDEGGFDMLPIMSSFGYQAETQYLNEGNFQALIEYVFLVSGIDQGRFIPSFTFLNGFRNNVSGWEIGFGPTFKITRQARGYFDNTGSWNLESAWNVVDTSGYLVKNPYKIVDRFDRRGNIKLSTAFVFTIGKTFKSGKLNIPVNLYIVPRKAETQIGLSFGFNNKK